MSTPPTATAGEPCPDPRGVQCGRGCGRDSAAGGPGHPLATARPLTHASTPRTPLHCAASCNDTAICTALVQHGAAIFATTLSDGATAIEKCDPYREGYADCATYLAGARQLRGASAVGRRSWGLGRPAGSWGGEGG